MSLYTIRSTPLNVDGLIMSEEDIARYTGHHSMYKYHFVGGRASKVRAAIDDVNGIKEWLRPSTIEPDDIARWKGHPAIKILFVKTHNEFTADPAKNPVQRMVPGMTPLASLQNHKAQGEMIKEIFRHASLPLDAVGSYIKGQLTFMSVPSYQVGSDSVDGGNVTSLYCSGTSWCIAWSYFHATKHTSAVMLFREGDGDARRAELEQEILLNQDHIGHPLLLAYLKTKISLQWTFKMLDKMNYETLDIEKSVGLATWDWCLDRRIEGFRSPQDVEQDTEEAIAKAQKQAIESYNVVSGQLNNMRFRLRSFLVQLAWLKRSNKAHMLTLEDDEKQRPFQCHALGEDLERMSDLTHVHLHDADTLFDRLAQQMKSMSSLVSQRDTKISLAIADFQNELAWQSKNTNRAMVAIAVISAIFLPATFVASLFQTPMFNWQPKGNEVVVVEPFWIYWVVCMSLTALLAACWCWYIKRRNAADREKRKAVNEAFRKKILRPPSISKVTRAKDPKADGSNEAGGWFTLKRYKPKIIDEEIAMRILSADRKSSAIVDDNR